MPALEAIVPSFSPVFLQMNSLENGRTYFVRLVGPRLALRARGIGGDRCRIGLLKMSWTRPISEHPRRSRALRLQPKLGASALTALAIDGLGGRVATLPYGPRSALVRIHPHRGASAEAGVLDARADVLLWVAASSGRSVEGC